MTWTERAQRPAAPEVPDLGALTPDQLRAMASELLTALAERRP